MRIPRLLKQWAIRAGAMLAVKLIGLVGRVILTRIIGAEGIGLYQIAYSFYGFLLMLTSGFPTTLAMATAKGPKQGWRVLIRVSQCLILCCGLLSLAVFWCRKDIAVLLGNAELEYAIHSLALSLFAVPLLGLVRGYLQGMKQFGIIALSEIVEQSVRFLCMLLLIGQFLSLGVAQAMGYGLYGTFAGAFISFSLLTLFISVNKDKMPSNRTGDAFITLSWFAKTSLAISATRLFVPLSEFLDALIVPNRLIAAGYSAAESTAIYGVVYGMAVLVVYAPTLFTGALSHILTSHMVAESQRGKNVTFMALCRTAFSTSWIWGGVTGLFLFVYAEELSFYIFHTDSASQVIRLLAWIPLIVGFREVSTSVLWAEDIRKNPFLGLLTGIACSIVCQFTLVGIPGFGYKGAAIAILVLEGMATLWNLSVLRNKQITVAGMAKPLLMDLAFGLLVLLGIIHFFHPQSGSLLSLWRFVQVIVVYFTASGIYMYYRGVRKFM
ncbi:oligosaccharide flippase family protein [Paenibacillus spiritus]|uniref:Oligosaccharide flippase family protein n=1 Tax=Paenibacillus spiritus TaxID=2496557 RepID=A0A5J5G8N9_9BACL|nr:oligosaccharide flippase family protein [Paenibacillus spiritus]KAA9004190.1 oligosaccharide flippase family protein [Paenibacillus spiritus]